MKIDDDPFDLANLRLPPDRVQTVTRAPRKIAKRREHFVRLPFSWIERLTGASGQTWHLAVQLLYLRWRKGAKKPIKLANRMLQIDGISRATKWRALAELEHRGLITIERQSGKSPLIHVHDLSQS
jgi:hypothetical protein